MNFEQIKTYIKVVETGSFSKAAVELFISNVAVLKQINSLEKEFSTQFFNRCKKGCTLTPEGELFLEKAKELINIYSQLSIDFGTSKENKKAIRIGYDPENGTDYLEKLLSIAQDHNIDINLVKCRYCDYFTALEKNEIDLAFAAQINKNAPKSIIYKKLINVTYYAMYKKKYAYFDSNEIQLSDLNNFDVYHTPIRFNDGYNNFLKIIEKDRLHIMGISNFILSNKEGVFITTGLSRKVSDNYQLTKINNLNSSWGIIMKKENEYKLNNYLEIFRSIFR